jgi:hypothetical protein
MKTVVLVKEESGGFSVVEDGGYVKMFDVLHYEAFELGIMLLRGDYKHVLKNAIAPEGWTINGATGFTTIAEVREALDALLVTSASLVFTDPSTGLRFRTIIRDSQMFFDKELTTDGFGPGKVESTDGGLTGDWMTIGGF